MSPHPIKRSGHSRQVRPPESSLATAEIAAKRCAEYSQTHTPALCKRDRECGSVKEHVVVQPAIPTSSIARGNGYCSEVRALSASATAEKVRAWCAASVLAFGPVADR